MLIRTGSRHTNPTTWAAFSRPKIRATGHSVFSFSSFRVFIRGTSFGLLGCIVSQARTFVNEENTTDSYKPFSPFLYRIHKDSAAQLCGTARKSLKKQLQPSFPPNVSNKQPIAIRNILTQFRRCGRGNLKGAAFRQRPLSRLLINFLAGTRKLPPEGPALKVSRRLGI